MSAQAAHRSPTNTQTHQSPKAAQLWLLEGIKLPIKAVSLAPVSHLPLLTCVLMQRKTIIMQLETEMKEKRRWCGAISACENNARHACLRTLCETSRRRTTGHFFSLMGYVRSWHAAFPQ